MIRIQHTLLLFLLGWVTSLTAQEVPPTAENILKEAMTQASKENKKVFILFHASWCGWCHKMDASMNDKDCKNFFDENFIIRHLVVFETKGKEHLENPGALDILRKMNADRDGIPYWLIYDSNGVLLADSKIRNATAASYGPGENVGCPASQEEVDYFIGVLKKTTSLNPEQLAIIHNRFRKNSPR